MYLGWYPTAAAFIASILVLEAIIRRDSARLANDPDR